MKRIDKAYAVQKTLMPNWGEETIKDNIIDVSCPSDYGMSCFCYKQDDTSNKGCAECWNKECD